MPKINNDEFKYPWIEYLHFAAWYREVPRSRVGTALSVVDSIEKHFGAEEVGAKRSIFLAMIPSECDVPGDDWKRQNVFTSTTAKNAPVREFLSRPNVLSVDAHIADLLVGREAGVFPKLRLVDQRWLLHVTQEQEYPNEQNDSVVLVSIRTDLLREDRNENRAEQLCDDLTSALLAAGDVYHMMVECNHFKQDAAGQRYMCGADINTTWSTIPHQLEDELWTRAGRARRDKVRGIHWGNYLCPDHVRRLRDPEGLIKEFTRLVTNRPGNSRYIKHYPDGGMFIKLSQSPMAQSRWGPDAALGDLAALLHRHFRAADLLF